MYWLRLNLTVAACFRLIDKPANAGGLTSYFLAEARRTQRNSNKTILPLQKNMSPQRSLHLCESKYL